MKLSNYNSKFYLFPILQQEIDVNTKLRKQIKTLDGNALLVKLLKQI